MNPQPYQPGNFSKSTYINDFFYYVGQLAPIINPPTYNVNMVDAPGGVVQPGEAQDGALGVQSTQQPAAGGLSPLVIGAGAVGVLTLGIVLVKVLD